MAQDGYSPNSGSIVANQLQDILARKALDARQAQNDAVHAADVQSQIAARNAAANYNTQRIAGLNSDREAQEVNRHLSNFSKDQPLIGADRDYVQQHAPSMIVPGQPAQPDWSSEGAPDIPATPDTFYGLPVQRDKAKVADEKAAALKVVNSPAFDKLTPIQKEQTYYTATGRSLAASLANPQDKTVHWVDPDSIYNGMETDPNTRVIPRPPKEPRPPAPHIVATQPAKQPDPDNPGQFIPLPGQVTELFSDGSRKNVADDFSDLRKPGATPPKAPPPPKVVPKIDPKLVQAFTKLMDPRQKATTEHKEAALNLAIGSITDKVVQKDVKDIFHTPQLRAMPVDQIATTLTGLTPDQVNEVKDHLRLLGLK